MGADHRRSLVSDLTRMTLHCVMLHVAHVRRYRLQARLSTRHDAMDGSTRLTNKIAPGGLDGGAMR